MRPSARRPLHAPETDAELRAGIATWASMVRRRRAAVLVRRQLIAWLAVALVAEIVLLAAGDERVGFWLLAPVALALLGGAIALRGPSQPQLAARMLDRFGDLHDLMATATAILAVEQPASGLAALVLDEARAAAGGSLATVRPVASGPRREWRLLGLAVAALAVVALVPAPARTGARGSRRGAVRAPAAGSAHGRPASSHAAARSARARVVGQPVPPQLPSPSLTVSAEGPARSSKSGFSPYGHGGTALSAKQLAQEGLAAPPAAAQSLGTVAVGQPGGSPGHGAGTQASAKGGAGGAGKAAPGGQATPSSGHAAGATEGLGTPAKAGSSAQGTTTALGTRRPSASSGAASTGSSPPGGSGAGTGRGGAGLASGLVPALGTGPLGLPLQAGYAPGGTRRSQSGEGVTQTPNGSGSGGRSAHASTGAEASVSSQLSVIPPTVNSTPDLDQGVLSGYFGSSNQLTPGNW